jgi:alpha-tubulin suppressor-like RCC1 family protein
MKTRILNIFVLYFVFNLYADTIHGGWVVSWGDSAGRESTGVSPYKYTTNLAEMKTQMTNASLTRLRFLPGTITIDGRMANNATAISAGVLHPFALNNDGGIFSWGTVGWGTNRGLYFAPPDNLTNVIAISAGQSHNLALKQDGTVVAWGEKRYGALDIPEGLSNVVAITTASGFNSLALKNDGTVVGWGQSVKIPPGLSNVVAIAADPALYMGINSPGHALALIKDGTVVDFDWSTMAIRSHVVEGLSNAVSIAAGPIHDLAIRKDGTVFCWGFGEYGELNPPSGLTNAVAIAASGTSFPANGYSLALKADGTLVTWGGFFPKGYSLSIPEGLSNIVAIAAAPNYCLAITTNAAVAEKFRQVQSMH